MSLYSNSIFSNDEFRGRQWQLERRLEQWHDAFDHARLLHRDMDSLSSHHHTLSALSVGHPALLLPARRRDIIGSGRLIHSPIYV